MKLFRYFAFLLITIGAFGYSILSIESAQARFIDEIGGFIQTLFIPPTPTPTPAPAPAPAPASAPSQSECTSGVWRCIDNSHYQVCNNGRWTQTFACGGDARCSVPIGQAKSEAAVQPASGACVKDPASSQGVLIGEKCFRLTAGYGKNIGISGNSSLKVGENTEFSLRWDPLWPNEGCPYPPTSCMKWGTQLGGAWTGSANRDGGQDGPFSFSSQSNVGAHNFQIGCNGAAASNLVLVIFQRETQQQSVCPNDDKCNPNGQCWNRFEERDCVRDPNTNWTCWKGSARSCSPGSVCQDATGKCAPGVTPAGGGGPGGAVGIPAPSSGSGSRVYGIVFLDRNQNGSFDGGDTRLSNETVYLHNTPGTQVLGTTSTDGSGGYSFDRLAGGNYRITHYVPSGYVRTTDDSRPFSVPPDQNWNFGIFGSAPLPPPSPLPPPPPPLGDENSGTGGTGLPPSIPFLQQAPAGPGGAGAPQLPQCSDGIDNDNDGLIDLSDPGCSSPSDNNEYNFRIREIIPDFFNLNWFKLNISNLLETRALGKQ